MGILKKIFSRIVLFGLVILLQIAFLVFIFGYLASVNPIASQIIIIIEYVFGIIIILRIIAQKKDPDFKIPWLILFGLSPLLGILVWVFFANHGMKKKDIITMTASLKKAYHYIDYSKENEEEIKTRTGKYAGAFSYLWSTATSRSYLNSKIEYYKIGEEFFPAFIESLKTAEKFILMEFFIIDYGKEWDLIHEVLVEKAKQGVEVRLLFDDIGCISTLKGNFVRKLRKEGIYAVKFNTFIPVLSGAFNNRDHRKIAVIDHKIGWTGGINLADEYANDIVRFGYWKDAMVSVKGPALKNLIYMAMSAFDMTLGRESDYEKYMGGEYPVMESDSIICPFGDGPAPIFQDQVGEQTFINMISTATKSVYISTPYLIPTYNLMSALRNAALRGVDVRILVPGIPDKKLVWLMARNNFKFLHEAGVKISIYEKGFNHEKAVVVDDELAFIGTINMDYRSLIHHFECGVLAYKSQAIHDINKDLLDCFNESVYYDGKNYSLNFFQGLLCKILQIFAPLL